MRTPTLKIQRQRNLKRGATGRGLKVVRAFTNSWAGGGGGKEGSWWNQLSTFDAEFKFAKIQNSYVRGGGGGGLVGWLVGWWNQLSTFDAEFKFAVKKKNFFCKKCSKFSGKNVPGNGFRL